MDPPEIYYEDPCSLMLVNPKGKMKRLYTPFRVLVREDIGQYQKSTWLYIEKVAEHRDYRIIFLISSYWYPHQCFRLPM